MTQLYWFNLSWQDWSAMSWYQWDTFEWVPLPDFNYANLPLVGYYYVYYGYANIASNHWYINTHKRHALKVFEDFQSVDPYDAYGCVMNIQPAEETVLNINSFSDTTTNQENISIIPDESDGEDITLSMNDKVVNLLFDQSGSMGWNDPEEKRYDIAERMVRRISSTYPGSVQYTVFKFGGKTFTMVFGATSEEDFPLNNLNCSADTFGDVNNNFFGIRVIRNKNRIPSTPIDGEIVFDGITNSIIDDSLVLGQTYYYKVFTFDNYGNFSDGKTAIVTINSDSVPTGLSLGSAISYKGSGVRKDDYTEILWHFGEGDGLYVYDFGLSSKDLISSGSLQWLNKIDVPVGNSGIRFPGDSSYTVSTSSILDGRYKRDMTVMLWVKPFVFGSSQPLVTRQSDTQSDWELNIDIAGRLAFSVNSVIYGTSSFALSLEEWNHVSFAIDGNGNGEFYINGLPAGTFSSPNSNIATPKYINVGYDRIGPSYFFGEITEVSIHTVARPFSYIQLYSSVSVSTDNDNGDRLAVINVDVPQSINYNSAHILTKPFSSIYNETDGEVIYSDSASSGSFYVTYNNLIPGSVQNFRIFTQNIDGNYSSIYDSQNIPLSIPSMSEEAYQRMGDISTLPQVSVERVISAKNEIYIQWGEISLSDYPDASHVQVYYSNDSYPVVGNLGNSGTLVFESPIEDASAFVHRNLSQNEDYYYTIAVADIYGKTGVVTNVKARTEGPELLSFNLDPNVEFFKIPLLNVDGVSYEILSDSSVRLFWSSILPIRTLQRYFDQNVTIYAKIVDDEGNEITNSDNLDVALSVTSSMSFVEDAAPDIFVDESTLPDLAADDLYSYAIEKLSDGVTKGSVFIKLPPEAVKNVGSLNLTIKYKIIIENPEDDSKNLFEYLSLPVDLTFVNPAAMTIANRDNRQVTVKCSNSIVSLNKQPYFSYIKYNGVYLGASDPYTMRVYVTYKGEAINPVGSVEISIHDAQIDLCDSSATPIDLGISADISILSSDYSVKTEYIETLDENGNPTGLQQQFSYVDIPILIPKTQGQSLVFVKHTINGYSFVKKELVVFRSPLRIDVLPRIPICDGINKSEQFAYVYLLDSNYPDDVSKRTPLEDIWIKWSLYPVGDPSGGSIKTFSYNGPDSPPPLFGSGLYSKTDSSGIARYIQIGPIQNVQITDVDSDGNLIYERYSLTTSCYYENYVANESQVLEFVPVGASDTNASGGSYLLGEFQNYKQEFWTNGRNYAKMTISHNPNSSSTKFSDAFRNCVTSADKPLVEMASGQSVLVKSSNSNIEIIWGDVVEYVDPYVGDWVLDTTNATIDIGHAFVTLSDDINTQVYFRWNSNVGVNRTTGFEKPLRNICRSFLGISSQSVYEDEVDITLDAVATYNSSAGNSVSISLQGGGSVVDGIIPTVLIPKEPLIIRAMDRRANGISVDSFVIDGVTENKLIIDVSFAGLKVPDDTAVSISVVNNNGDVLSVSSSTVYTLNSVDSLIDSVERSYAEVTFEPIPKGTTFDANVYMTVSYDLSGDVARSQTICINLSADAEDSAGQVAPSSIRSIFSKAVESCDIAAAPAVSWTIKGSLNEARGHAVVKSVNNKIYAIGGINGSFISGTLEVYDPMTDLWTYGASMSVPRMMAQSAVVGTDIYVIGGINYDKTSNELFVVQTVEKYDTINDVWTLMEEMPDINTGGPLTVSYGVAGGIAEVNGGNIYILSGIREISVDGNAVDYNDRILSYNTASDTWSYTDSISDSDFSIYARVFPVSIIDGGKIKVFSGMYQDSTSSYFSTSAYSYEAGPGIISDITPEFDELPDFRSKASLVSFAGIYYILGGVTPNTNSSNIVEMISPNALPNPIYTKQYMTDMIDGKNGAGTAIINDGVNDLLFVVGGIDSGKGSSFLSVEAEVFNNTMFLNRDQFIDVKISLKNNVGDYPLADISVFVRGYLQLSSVEEGMENLIPKNLLQYSVVFESKTVVTHDGVGYVRLLPRYDDYLKNIMETLYLNESSPTLRYKIVVQAIIEDAKYYGQNFINVVEEFPQTPVGYETVECTASSTNICIEGLQAFTDFNNFDLISDPLRQSSAPVINVYADRMWLPSIDNMTPDGSVDATDAISIIDDLRENTPIGGSPLYDALVEEAQFLIGDDFYGIEKSIYAFTDKEPNSSVSSLEEAAIEINGIDGYGETPIIILNMSLEEDSALGALRYVTDSYELNELVNKTNGQGITLADYSVVDDAVYMISGLAKGALGYGKGIFTFDLGSIVNIKDIKVNYDLFSNTNGAWRISVSEDGFNYTDYSIRFKPNYTASFDNTPGRYLKFYLELFSGMSISNEEAYDDIPSPGLPVITDIDVYYAPQKIDYIFTNKTSPSSSVSQISTTVNANSLSGSGKAIRLGAANGKYSHNWSDYQNSSKKYALESGQITIPLRNGTVEGYRLEPLVSYDNYLYKAVNGSWSPEATVVVQAVSGGLIVTISSTAYRLDARNGVVIFEENQKEYGDHYISIYNDANYRLGLQITNNSSDYTKIYGIAHMYNIP